jgi:uncharacterized membrane protein YjjB (DUF3815 family)
MNTRIATTAPAVTTSADTILRGLAAILAFGVAQIHFLDVFDKFKENTSQAWMFVALIVGCLVAALALVHRSSALVFVLAGLCGLAPLVMYILSRSVGLAGATDDIGNWAEPLGLASISTEASLVMVSVYALWVGRGKSPMPADD